MKVPSPLDHVSCFEIFLTMHPVMFSTDLYWSLNAALPKKPANLILKEAQVQKCFLKLPKE